MNKKAKYITIIIIAIGLTVTSVEAVGYFQSQSPYCSVDPYNANCFCYDTEVRGQYTEAPGKYQYICYPSEPSGYYELPIETWEEALQFIEYNFGTKECHGLDTLLESPYKPGVPFTESGFIPEEYMDSLIELRCLKISDYYADGRIRSFTVSWAIMFYPRSGNIWERICNPDYIDNCPDNIRPFSTLNALGII